MSSAILLIVWSALLPLSLSRDDMALTCQPITNATMCFNMNWNYTSLPNARDHSDQQEASGELNHFLPLIRQQCSNAIVHFLCSVYIPYCTNVGENIGSSTSLTLDPCREVCEYVRKGCEPFYHNYSTLSWPPHLMCERFPVAQPCFNITDIESVHIPLGLQLMTPTNISGSIVSEPWQYHDGSSVSYTSKSSSTITITTSNISTSHSDIISTTSIEACKWLNHIFIIESFLSAAECICMYNYNFQYFCLFNMQMILLKAWCMKNHREIIYQQFDISPLLSTRIL